MWTSIETRKPELQDNLLMCWREKTVTVESGDVFYFEDAKLCPLIELADFITPSWWNAPEIYPHRI